MPLDMKASRVSCFDIWLLAFSGRKIVRWAGAIVCVLFAIDDHRVKLQNKATLNGINKPQLDQESFKAQTQFI